MPGASRASTSRIDAGIHQAGTTPTTLSTPTLASEWYQQYGKSEVLALSTGMTEAVNGYSSGDYGLEQTAGQIPADAANADERGAQPADAQVESAWIALVQSYGNLGEGAEQGSLSMGDLDPIGPALTNFKNAMNALGLAF